MNSTGENIAAILFVFFGFLFVLISYMLWTEPVLSRTEFWKYMGYTFIGTGIPAMFFFYLIIFSETYYEFHSDTGKILYINNMFFKVKQKTAQFKDVEAVFLVTETHADYTSYYCDLALKNRKKIRFTHKRFSKSEAAEEGKIAAELIGCPFGE